jgi:predicted amidohydrolase YtcJ
VLVQAGELSTAIAIRGDRIVSLGEEAEREIGPSTRVVDLRGRLVTPGMNDAHCHLGAGGLSMLEVDLRGPSSLKEIESRVRAAAAKVAAGEWITGRGWDQTRLRASELGPGGWPTKETLDRASPQNPVYLRRVDGHTGWASSRALQLARIDSKTPDPPGGEIVRDSRGAPTGILKEKAQDLVARIVPPPSPEKLRRGIRAALDLASRTGVTSVQSEVTPAELAIYRALRSEGKLTVRLYGWLPLTMEVVRAMEERGEQAASGDAWLRTGLVKAYADGTLGSRTASMLEPYSDDPSTRGIQRIPQAEMDALVLAADRAGLQVAVHAIGDAANREVLDAIERAAAATGRKDARHRIEHAQVIDSEDIPRFARLGVIASMQPTHATSDMRWAEDRIGHARAEEGAYAWRKLLDAHARVAFGTDFAVEPLDPVEGLYSAVTRQSREKPGTPPGGWLPSQRLSMEEAIALYTAGSAYAEFQETVKGTLEPGKLADLVVWDRDLLTVAPEQVLQAKPALTMAGGAIVYQEP